MKIICIGRNYADHAKELNNDVPDEPVIFLKPDSALLPKNRPFFIPDFTDDVHHELEIVVKIKKIGKHIQEKYAPTYYDEIGLGIDFTARDLQQKLKSQGLPWEKAKGFDGSAVLGDFLPKEKVNLDEIKFELLKNGSSVQRGNSYNMIFSIDRIISEVSKYFTLKIGDLIYTGTPAGVGKVAIGDTLEGFFEGKKLLHVDVR